MAREGETPQCESLERRAQSAQISSRVHPEQASGDTSEQVIFDRLAEIQGQLEQIHQVLLVQTNLAQRLLDVRVERDRPVQRQQAEQERRPPETERGGLRRDAATGQERQAQGQEQRVQDEAAKQERRRQLNAEAQQRYRRSRGAQGREEHAAYMRQWRFRRSQQR